MSIFVFELGMRLKNLLVFFFLQIRPLTPKLLGEVKDGQAALQNKTKMQDCERFFKASSG